jgi:hypothetical protein
VQVRSTEPAETDGYVRITGTVVGVVDPKEAVVGLGALPKTPDGQYQYRSEFELVVPATGQPVNEVVYVDAENRGTPISWRNLGPTFLPTHATSYARVQWQAGISPGVPAAAQGVGLVVVRDFARWLAGRTPETQVAGTIPKQAYGKLILGGVSQGAFMVDTLIAEGFNVDPKSGQAVFDAAIAIDGLGNWLAINQIAAKRGTTAQAPYLDPDGVPLKREELLSRPKTDPLFVDVANYTDFYRLRASLTSTTFSSPRFRRYDWPSPHAIGTTASLARCAAGPDAVVNPTSYAPYFRALVIAVEREIGVKAQAKAHPLPPGAVFTLADSAPTGDGFNPLSGQKVVVPKTDQDGWPVGGVRFPEAVLPLGVPDPVALSPVTTASIDATCGNIGGWKPWDPVARARRYGSAATYATRYARQVQALLDQGYLLPEDAKAMKPPPGAMGAGL